MLKRVAFLLVILVSTNWPLSAQVTIDISKISCDQFALYKVASPDTIAIWLHGYFSGPRDNTVVDVEALKSNTKKVREYCLKNSDVPLMQAVQAVLKP
jgi:acid stress chaperone HdeB